MALTGPGRVWPAHKRVELVEPVEGGKSDFALLPRIQDFLHTQNLHKPPLIPAQHLALWKSDPGTAQWKWGELQILHSNELCGTSWKSNCKSEKEPCVSPVFLSIKHPSVPLKKLKGFGLELYVN